MLWLIYIARQIWVELDMDSCPVKACLHVLSPSLGPSSSQSKYNIVPMVTVRLMGRMCTEPTLSIKQSVSIDTMINFDRDGDGHGDEDGMCKQALKNIRSRDSSLSLCNVNVHSQMLPTGLESESMSVPESVLV